MPQVVHTNPPGLCDLSHWICDPCGERFTERHPESGDKVMPDEAMAIAEMRRLKAAAEWPPKCQWCGDPIPQRLAAPASA